MGVGLPGTPLRAHGKHRLTLLYEIFFSPPGICSNSPCSSCDHFPSKLADLSLIVSNWVKTESWGTKWVFSRTFWTTLVHPANVGGEKFFLQ